MQLHAYGLIYYFEENVITWTQLHLIDSMF